MQKYRNRVIIGVIIALVIYIGILLVFDNQGQLTEGVLEALQTFPAWLIIPLIGTQLAVAFFRFLVWQYYLGVIGARNKISRLDSAVIFVAGFIMVLSPGKAAELLKTVFLKLKTGVPVTRSAPIVIAERVVDGLSVMIILVASLLLLNEQLSLGSYLELSQTIVFSTAGLLFGGLIAIQIAPLAHFLLDLLARIPFLGRLAPSLRDFYASSREIFRLQNIVPAAARGVGVYLFSTIGFILILWGFGVEITPTTILQATFINGVTAAIGALSFVPNGAGITEISTMAMLNAIIAPAHPVLTMGAAAAASLLQGFFHKWFRVLLGLVVAVIFRNRLFPPDHTTALESELAAMTHETKAQAEASATAQTP